MCGLVPEAQREDDRTFMNETIQIPVGMEVNMKSSDLVYQGWTILSGTHLSPPLIPDHTLKSPL